MDGFVLDSPSFADGILSFGHACSPAASPAWGRCIPLATPDAVQRASLDHDELGHVSCC